MPIELVDCHTHTVFSDGKSTFQENMQEALAKGITTIACTDHWGRPSFIDCSIEEGKLKQYAFAIERVRGRISRTRNCAWLGSRLVPRLQHRFGGNTRQRNVPSWIHPLPSRKGARLG